MKGFSMAIIGVTGLVGRTLVDVINETNPPIEGFYLYASKKSIGKSFNILGKTYAVAELSDENVVGKKIDVAVFCVSAKLSRKYAKLFVKNNALVIDNSTAFRRSKTTPLIVPEVNEKDMYDNRGIISNPNCSTIQGAVVLKPLHDAFKIKRVIFTTFQSVSGAGQQGVFDLQNGIKGIKPTKFSRNIFGNAIPKIDEFLKNGYTKEEEKIIYESKKILKDKNIKVTATCVRVPVFVSHAESVNVEFCKPVTLKKIVSVLKAAPNVIVADDNDFEKFPTQAEVQGKNEVFVGRIRKDNSNKNAVNLWIVADNLRKGAATNALQIAVKYFANRS